MGAPSFLLCLPPYFQLLFLQQLFTLKLQGLLGDSSCTDPEENGTGSRRKGLWKVSQPCPLPQNKAFNTAIAADRCLLLTDLHLWNSYHWLPTHLFSDSLPFFYYYLGLEETTTHPSYNLSPIYHMISNSVLSLHPHKCLLPHFQGISHTTLHGTFLPYVQCLKLHLQSKGLSWISPNTPRFVNPSLKFFYHQQHQLYLKQCLQAVTTQNSCSCFTLPKFSTLLKRILSFPTISSLLQPFLQVAKTILNSNTILS